MGIYFIGGKIPPKMVLEVELFGPAKLREPKQEEKRMHELIEKLPTLSNKDEWWLWKRIGGREVLSNLSVKLDKTQIEVYLKEFEKIFDNNWWHSTCKKQRKSMPSDPLGVFGSQFPIIKILRIGECLHYVGGKNNLPIELIKRLRNKKTFQAAATELEIASCFIQAGFKVMMYPPTPSGSKPDGKVIIDGGELFYEVTEQHFSSYETFVWRYENKIIDWLSKNCEPVTGSIEFKSRKDKPDIVIEELLDLLMSHYDKKVRMLDRLPFVFENEHFRIYLDKADKYGGWLGINGLEPKPEVIVRNWIKQLFKKAKQLPAGKSGVIIGSPLFLWGPNEVKYAHEEVYKKLAGGAYTRISGIILCAKHVENSGFIKHVPSIIINRNAKIKNAERIKMMAEALFRFPDWL